MIDEILEGVVALAGEAVEVVSEITGETAGKAVEAIAESAGDIVAEIPAYLTSSGDESPEK